VELILHESLIAVLDNGKVLELLKPVGNVGGGNEETSKQHEGHDQHRCKRHSELLVCEGSGDNQGVAGEGVVDEDQNQEVHHEGLEGGAEADAEVADETEYGGDRDGEGELGNHLGPEVRRHIVHVVVDLTQEDRALVGENENNVLNGVEGAVHGHEEAGTLDVLDAFAGLGAVPEQEGGEQGSHSGGRELHIGGLGQTDNVAEVARSQQLPLVAEAKLDVGDVFVTLERRAVGVLGAGVATVLTRDVLGIEELNEALILVLDTLVVVVEHRAALFFFGLELDALNGHHAHEVIGGVAHLGALEADGGEVVDGPVGFAEENNLTTGKQGQEVEQEENFGVRLMDSRAHSTGFFLSHITEHSHNTRGCE